jgi:hypothetical protein
MTNTRLVYPGFLILVSMWWGWTVLVDMFIIRTVFSIIDNFFQAGDLGIAVFSRLNNLEVIVSTSILAMLSYQITKNKKIWILFTLSIIAWLMVMFYFSYLTPKLVELTELWKKAEAGGSTGIAGIKDIQQSHQSYHKLYIGMDVLKLLLLSLMVTVGVFKQDQWS